MILYRSVINKQLIPELNELKNELEKRDIEELFMKYPNIIYVVENLESVEKEIEQWKTLAVA